jgi:hypothetical protein
MKKQILSEEFKRMQKLAGIINEAQSTEYNVDDFIYKTSNERPKKDDWVLKFKQANQMDFKSGELKKKDYKYFPVKVPMESFLNPEDLKIIATNNPKLIKDGIPSLNINESQSVMFKNKKYYIENPEGKEKVFAFLDPELKQIAKINNKTLMFNVKDLDDNLIK